MADEKNEDYTLDDILNKGGVKPEEKDTNEDTVVYAELIEEAKRKRLLNA